MVLPHCLIIIAICPVIKALVVVCGALDKSHHDIKVKTIYSSDFLPYIINVTINDVEQLLGEIRTYVCSFLRA